MADNPMNQVPYSLNQIEQNHPNVERTFNLLEGDIAGSLNGGHERTITYKRVKAGERIMLMGANMNIQLMVPKTPSFQRLKAVVKCVNVPDVRVWDNAMEFWAQGGGSSEIKVTEIPHPVGLQFPLVYSDDNTALISYQETTAYRDSFLSSYIPKMGVGIMEDVIQQGQRIPYNKIPPINILPIRADVAMYNDLQRNKEYMPKRQEFHGDTVTLTEMNSYIMSDTRDMDYFFRRARRDNSYYMNYRTELQGFELEIPSDSMLNENAALLNWSNWESYMAESRSQVENSQKNSWDIAQELNGAPKLTEGRTQLLAKRVFDINYSSVTQNAYNNNSEIEEKYRVLGFQGGFSYTNIDLGFINGLEIKEHGTLLVTLCITADTVFESAIHRVMLNTRWDEIYRPDLVGKKLDTIYESEFGTPFLYNDGTDDLKKAVGFKRAFNEEFTLPSVIFGDMSVRGSIQTDYEIDGQCRTFSTPNRILPNNTYQFFEFAGNYEYDETYSYNIEQKKIWLDYTDLMLNRNQVIKMPIFNDSGNVDGSDGGMCVLGNNQIFYVGKVYCISDMPISPDIKDNFTKYGEH